MDPIRFEARLRTEGFPEIRTHPMSANAHNAEGDITLTVNGAARTYRKGEEFSMKAACRHVEGAGPLA